MGVTPLSTNSQNRLYGAYFSINTYMLSQLQRKLIRRQSPKVEYIEKIPEFKVDVDTLLSESLSLEDKTFNQYNNGVLVQKKFSLMSKGVFDSSIDAMPYTRHVADIVSSHIMYNAIYYRFLMPNACYPWHNDIMNMCAHIPLTTNEGCKFIYTDRLFDMPADGSIYLVNNQRPHTFINSGKFPRLHITFDII